MKANNGGPAFPSQYTITEGSFNPHTGTVAKCNQVYIELGASLRDYFAAQAMQAFVSGHIAHYGHGNPWPLPGIAESAYELADAMLAARAKGASNG